MDTSETLLPGKDFVLNEAEVVKNTHFLRLPASTNLFAGPERASYEALRSAYLIVKRERPVVPCPTNTVMPRRRMSKHQRSKLYSVYLRPWTLSQKLASADVPFAGDLGLRMDGDSDAVRTKWKQYTQQVWPHAFNVVRNFMANALADGSELC